MDTAENRFREPGWVGHPLSDWSPELVAECQQTGGPAFRANLNVYATLAHHPRALVAWVGLGRSVVEGAGLSPADRERIILWTSSRCGGKYPFARHALLARAVGVTEPEIRELADRPSERWPTPLQDAPALVLPLVGFYAAACLVLEGLRTPPDADILSEWPDWQGRSWRQPGIAEVGDRLRTSLVAESGRALGRLVAVLVEDRALSVPEWNGVVHVARRAFGCGHASTVLLDGPADTDADVVGFILNILEPTQRERPQPPPSARLAVEATLLAAAVGVLGA